MKTKHNCTPSQLGGSPAYDTAYGALSCHPKSGFILSHSPPCYLYNPSNRLPLTPGPLHMLSSFSSSNSTGSLPLIFGDQMSNGPVFLGIQGLPPLELI
jgi:hypothetical protein